MDYQATDILKNLVELITLRNRVASEISSLIGRPAQIGHVGEFIASQVFNINLEESASTPAIDGFFSEGSLRGQSVNIKWYARRENVLDITPEKLPNYYLVMTGPKTTVMTSKGQSRPWLIESVFLFKANELVRNLRKKRLKIGIATSVKQKYWDDAEIYPEVKNKNLILSDEQRHMLSFFQ